MNDQNGATGPGALIALGVLLAVWRAIVARSAAGWKGMIASICGSLACGYVVWSYVVDSGLRPGLVPLAVSLAVLVSHELLLAIVETATRIRRDPFGVLAWALTVVRPAAPPPPPPAEPPKEEEGP